MQMFYVEPGQIQGDRVTISGPDVNHIRTVLRMRPGEEVAVSDQRSFHACCRIETLQADQVVLTAKEALADTELSAEVILYQGLPKGDKMEWIIQKNTELGVARIVPVTMERSVVKLDGKKAAARLERWQAVAESAGKQSGRTRVPQVEAVMSYAGMLEAAGECDLLLLPYESASGIEETRRLLHQAAAGMRIGILVGPEGGFAPAEVDKAQTAGFQVMTLGRRILRTETAGMAMMAALMLMLEK